MTRSLTSPDDPAGDGSKSISQPSLPSLCVLCDSVVKKCNSDLLLIEIKLALSRYLKERRQKSTTQMELANKLHSSQPRIAKAENGDASVSIELLIRAMLATGVTPQEIGQIIANVG